MGKIGSDHESVTHFTLEQLSILEVRVPCREITANLW